MGIFDVTKPKEMGGMQQHDTNWDAPASILWKAILFSISIQSHSIITLCGVVPIAIGNAQAESFLVRHGKI